jgi:hypothetical protein
LARNAEPSDEQLANPPASCPYQFRRYGDEVVRFFTRPALHRPMFIDAPAFGNFLLFARFNNKRPDHPLLDDGRQVPEAWLQAIKAIGDRLMVEVAWKAGDVLMLDNTRFMHGRTAILDSAERLIATFFGYLSFAVPDPEEPADRFGAWPTSVLLCRPAEGQAGGSSGDGSSSATPAVSATDRAQTITSRSLPHGPPSPLSGQRPGLHG